MYGDRSVAQVARDLGINTQSLYSWVSKYRSEILESGVGLSPEQELRQLRKEVEDLRQEREILKKAAAYFAKNQR
jgi:transposase